jgi:CheY-like chemotaxis protein
MDVEMPNMDGIQATNLIKKDPRTSHIPVMIFTSLGGEDDLKRAQAAGCQGILHKPICKETLQDTLNKMFNGQ